MVKLKSFSATVIIFSGLVCAVPSLATIADKAVPEHTEDPEIEQCLDKYLPRIVGKDRKEREDALRRLRYDLQDLGNAKRKHPGKRAKKQISQTLIQVYRDTSAKDFDLDGGHTAILGTITQYGDDEIAKPFILNLLENGTDEERGEITRYLGWGRGITGDDVYDKVDELTKRGVLKREMRLLLPSLNKDRALPEIERTVRSSKDKREFINYARALQEEYRRPDDFKVFLTRIRELGLDKWDGFEGSHGLYWIDPELFAVYLGSATGVDLRLALEMSRINPRLSSPAIAPVFQQKLTDPDSKSRVLAAQVLRETANSALADRQAIRSSIQQALAAENDATVRRAFQEAIDGIIYDEKAFHEMLKRTGQYKR